MLNLCLLSSLKENLIFEKKFNNFCHKTKQSLNIYFKKVDLDFGLYEFKDLSDKDLDSLFEVAKNGFNLEDISKEEVLRKLSSDFIIVIKLNNKIEGFFSFNIVFDTVSSKLGIYNRGSVVDKPLQNKGIFSNLIKILLDSNLDFLFLKTQNSLVLKSFGDREIYFSIKEYSLTNQNIIFDCLNYLKLSSNFDKNSFIIRNIYPGLRSNYKLLPELNETDTKFLFYFKENNK